MECTWDSIASETGPPWSRARSRAAGQRSGWLVSIWPITAVAWEWSFWPARLMVDSARVQTASGAVSAANAAELGVFVKSVRTR